MGDAGGLQQVAVASAPLRVAPRGLVKGADRNPASGELAEGVVIRDQVLAANEELSGAHGRLGGEDASLDQLVGSVTCEKARMGVERVPAGRVVVYDATQARRKLSEVLTAGKSALTQKRYLPLKAVDRPLSCRHARIISHAGGRSYARNIPTARGWTGGARQANLSAKTSTND
jgi:hypothetical protein